VNYHAIGIHIVPSERTRAKNEQIYEVFWLINMWLDLVLSWL